MAKASRKKAGKGSRPTSSKSAKAKKKRPHIQEAFQTKTKLVIAVSLALLAILVYSPSHNYGFVYDDDAVVKDNKYVKEGLGGLGKIWTTTYFRGYDENMNARAFRPIPLTTLALEYEIFGLDASVNHKTNLLFYGLTAFFLFLFLSKLLRDHHPLLPILATLFFVVHPIHIEVVANIKSRDTMLGFLNLAIALWFLLKHIDNRKALPLALSLFFYTMALCSKEEVITSVATIPAMLWCFRKMDLKKVATYAMPFFILAAVFIAIRFAVIGGIDEGVKLTKLDNSLLAAGSFTENFAGRSASNLLVIGHYLLKTIWPHPLISDYSFSTIPLTSWGDWRVYVALMANLGLFALALFGLKKKRAWGFALFWYFASVSIFTSLLTPNVSAYNDRFLYTPVFGICLLAAWAICLLAKNAEAKNAIDFFQKNILAILISGAIMGVSLLKIQSHLPVWKDRFVLFEHDAQLTPDNARTRKNHGGSLARKAIEVQKTDPAKMQKYARAAIVELDTALNKYPEMPTGHVHKGNMHLLLQEYDLAVASFSEALRQAPHNYFAKSSLAIAYFHQGKYQASFNTLQDIPPHLRRESDKRMMERVRAYVK